MACKGSLFFEDLPEEESTDAAKEGTACGEYLERRLLNQQIPTHASNGVMFDDDMKYYTAPIFDDIMSKQQDGVLCETRIDWQTRSGLWVRGQYDASFIHEGRLYVDDLKYGWGLVEVTKNWQLLGYAIGEVIRRGVAFKEIVLRIHQPRPHHEHGKTREWRITYEQLLGFKEEIEQQLDALARGDKELASGHHCKYCEAAMVCPAFNKVFFRGVDLTHEFLQDNISDEEISFQLELMDRINEVFKTKKTSLEQLAVSRIKAGNILPNYITETKLSDRTWKKGISPEVIEMLTGKNVIEKKMMSPAKAEKIGVPKDMIETIVERKFLGQKLKRCDTSKLGNEIFGNPNG